MFLQLRVAWEFSIKRLRGRYHNFRINKKVVVRSGQEEDRIGTVKVPSTSSKNPD